MQLDNPICVHKVFGAKIMVLGGHFRQIVPIVPRKGRANIIDGLIANSYPICSNCTIFILQKNMRIREDNDEETYRTFVEFSNWVLDIGDGIILAIAMEGDDEASWI